MRLGTWTTSRGMHTLMKHLMRPNLSLRFRFRGTKVVPGQPEDDLGVVPSSKAARNVIQVELPSEPQDNDSHYSEALENIRTKKPLQKYSGNDVAEQDAAAKDYYANIRTNVS